jgi:hypothetical protein
VDALALAHVELELAEVAADHLREGGAAEVDPDQPGERHGRGQDELVPQRPHRLAADSGDLALGRQAAEAGLVGRAGRGRPRRLPGPEADVEHGHRAVELGGVEHVGHVAGLVRVTVQDAVRQLVRQDRAQEDRVGEGAAHPASPLARVLCQVVAQAGRQPHEAVGRHSGVATVHFGRRLGRPGRQRQPLGFSEACQAKG